VQPAAAWEYYYGWTEGGEEFACIQATRDVGYVTLGRPSFWAGVQGIWVVKLNVDGSVAWQKTYGGPGYDVARAIRQTAEGGYVVAGETSSYGAGGSDIWVLKLRPDGSIAWQYTYGGPDEDDRGTAIRQTEDGGFVVAGTTTSGWGYYSAVWVLKLRADGAVAWQKTYRSGDWDTAADIEQAADGGYVVAGSTDSLDPTGSAAWVLRLNEDGGLVWQRAYGEAGWSCVARAIRLAADTWWQATRRRGPGSSSSVRTAGWSGRGPTP
jgi:hypothetical protein